MGITNYVKGQTLHVGGTAGADPDMAQIIANTAAIAANAVLIGTPDGVSNAADIAVNVTDIADNVSDILLRQPLGALAGIRVPTANDILIITDVGKAVEMDNASARTVTVPPFGDVAFPVNSWIRITRAGAGTVLLVEGAAVTIRSAEGFLHLADQWSSAILYHRLEDEWVLSGDLSTDGA